MTNAKVSKTCSDCLTVLLHAFGCSKASQPDEFFVKNVRSGSLLTMVLEASNYFSLVGS